jgi:hypothetical protein
LHLRALGESGLGGSYVINLGGNRDLEEVIREDAKNRTFNGVPGYRTSEPKGEAEEAKENHNTPQVKASCDVKLWFEGRTVTVSIRFVTLELEQSWALLSS